MRYRNQWKGSALVSSLIAAGAITGVSVVGAVAYTKLTTRAGEAALNFIPAEAVALGSLDTAPSERQLLTFNAIKDAIKREGLDAKFDQAFGEAEGKMGEIRAQLRDAYAFGVWPGNEQRPLEFVIVAQILDQAIVEKLVQDFQGEEMTMEVVGEYVVMASSDEALVKAKRAHSGDLPSAADAAQVKEARSKLPEDANLMVFINMSGVMNEYQKLSEDKLSITTEGYSAMSITVDPDGLAFDSYSDVTDSKGIAKQAWGTVNPVNIGNIGSLPANPYGVVAIENPARFLDLVRRYSREMESASEPINDALYQMRKQTGIDFDKTLLPSLTGTMSLAVYPDTNREVDVAITVQGDPEALAELSDGVRKVMKKSASKGEPGQWRVTPFGSDKVWQFSDPIALMGEASGPLSEKRTAMLESGDTITFGTSRVLIQKFMNANAGGASLRKEPSFEPVFKQSSKGAQQLVFVDLAKIMASSREEIVKMAQEANLESDDVLNIFGDGSAHLVVTVQSDGQHTTSRTRLPLNYDRLIRIAGRLMNPKNK